MIGVSTVCRSTTALCFARCHSLPKVRRVINEKSCNLFSQNLFARVSFSNWGASRGHDITMESLTMAGNRPKVILQGYSTEGFVVTNQVKKVDPNAEIDSGALHLNGSVLAFPHGAFLWKVNRPEDVTLESLSAVILHRRPKLEYLFIGCNKWIPLPELMRIKSAMSEVGIFVENLDIGNAMGTFNILNAEDRPVAVALVVDSTDD